MIIYALGSYSISSTVRAFFFLLYAEVSMEVVEVLPGIWQASCLGFSVIGTSFAKSVQALSLEPGFNEAFQAARKAA